MYLQIFLLAQMLKFYMDFSTDYKEFRTKYQNLLAQLKFSLVLGLKAVGDVEPSIYLIEAEWHIYVSVN